MDVLYMFAIPVRWGEDIAQADVVDLRRSVDPTSDFYEIILKLMERRQCSALWLTKPKTRPSFVEAQSFFDGRKKFCECVPAEFREEVESLMSHAGKKIDVAVIKPTTSYFKMMRDNKDSVICSFFVQAVQHLNKSSRILYALAGKDAKKGVGVFQNTALSRELPVM